jgi:hypothetical protein
MSTGFRDWKESTVDAEPWQHAFVADIKICCTSPSACVLMWSSGLETWVQTENKRSENKTKRLTDRESGRRRWTMGCWFDTVCADVSLLLRKPIILYKFVLRAPDVSTIKKSRFESSESYTKKIDCVRTALRCLLTTWRQQYKSNKNGSSTVRRRPQDRIVTMKKKKQSTTRTK